MGLSWKNAWRLAHKVLRVMAARGTNRRLAGYGKADDVHPRRRWRNRTTLGLGAPGKSALALAAKASAELEHRLYAILEPPMQPSENASLRDGCARRLAADAELHSDDLACLAPAIGNGYAHSLFTAMGDRMATEICADGWVEVVPASAKRSTSGRYHKRKYARL